MEQTCIFCQIIQGKQPASVVYEDDAVLAIMDLYPINPGHVLVMPKACYASLREMPEELAVQVFRVLKKVEKAVWETPGIACEGTNILQNNGKSAWQDVFHVHFHVIPRFKDDKLKIKIQPLRPERVELDAVAAALREKL